MDTHDESPDDKSKDMEGNSHSQRVEEDIMVKIMVERINGEKAVTFVNPIDDLLHVSINNANCITMLLASQNMHRAQAVSKLSLKLCI
jgi:hypothetical protein